MENKQNQFSVFVDFKNDLFIILKNGMQILSISQNLPLKIAIQTIQNDYSELYPDLDIEIFITDINEIFKKIVEQVF